MEKDNSNISSVRNEKQEGYKLSKLVIDFAMLNTFSVFLHLTFGVQVTERDPSSLLARLTSQSSATEA